MTTQTQPTTRLISSADVRKKLGVSNTTLWRLIKANTIPLPVKLGRMNKWAESEINSYIERLTSPTTTS